MGLIEVALPSCVAADCHVPGLPQLSNPAHLLDQGPKDFSSPGSVFWEYGYTPNLFEKATLRDETARKFRFCPGGSSDRLSLDPFSLRSGILEGMPRRILPV